VERLLSHPKVGASWEGFVIEQVLVMEPHDEVFYGATLQGAEIDLILRRGDALYGVECKRAGTPRLTPLIGIALDDLKLTSVSVIYPGIQRFSLANQVEAVPLHVLSKGESLFG
jgi:predicted AAA+ superfamily ATPase